MSEHTSKVMVDNTLVFNTRVN